MLLLILSVLFGSLAIWWMFSPANRLKEIGNKMPGPRAYPIVGNIFNFNVIGTKAPQDWKDCMLKYGNTFRYWLGPELHVFISEPDDMQAILSSKTLISKSNNYKTLDSWLGTGLLISTGELWQRRRKAITPTFHFKILEEFVPTFNKCAKILVECLKEKAGKGSFLLTEYISNCALDTVAETAMGTELNVQTNPLDEYPNSIVRMTRSLIKRMCNPLLAIEPIYTISGRRKEESDHLKILFSVPLEVINKKQNEVVNPSISSTSTEEVEGVKKKTAFLELLLKMKQNNIPAFQTDQDVKDEVITFMFEGHDTTTMSLTYTIWLLGLHPEIQEALFLEISDVLDGQEPSLEDYQKMTYLDRVLKESLRLYPSVPIIGRLATHDIVLPVSGYVIPEGAQIDMYLFAMHRREDLFPEPDKFNPDRFLELQKHPFSYLPFSAGPRNCIGQKFAMIDMKAIICNLVLNYKIKSDIDLELDPEMLLRATKGPNVSLVLRK